MGNTKAKNSKKMDKKTSKPDLIHEDEMKKHKSKKVIRDEEI
ncbi:hypothetical protein RBU49_13985 [Clostridium sp. MB40-C1]|nr:hypothetical protein [Clostridium sp. MB40-C1]WMJ79967.1 hypothetical protein RBU49_13985 [Clostridium sp. MB40-C1]